MIKLKKTELIAIGVGSLLIIFNIIVVLILFLYEETPQNNNEIIPASDQSQASEQPPVDLITQDLTAASNTKTVPTNKPTTTPLPQPIPEEKKLTPIISEQEPAPDKNNEPVELSEAAVNASLMLDAHNKIRVSLNLNPLTWSTTLANSAKTWSDILKSEDCKIRHDYNSPYGENIYWEKQSGGKTDSLISTEKAAVYWWSTEEEYYDYDTNTCKKGEVCGHYTQIIWSDTTEVGCGVSSCISGSSRSDIWVCRYNPAGNVIGNKPY